MEVLRGCFAQVAEQLSDDTGDRALVVGTQPPCERHQCCGKHQLRQPQNEQEGAVEWSAVRVRGGLLCGCTVQTRAATPSVHVRNGPCWAHPRTRSTAHAAGTAGTSQRPHPSTCRRRTCPSPRHQQTSRNAPRQTQHIRPPKRGTHRFDSRLANVRRSSRSWSASCVAVSADSSYPASAAASASADRRRWLSHTCFRACKMVRHGYGRRAHL